MSTFPFKKQLNVKEALLCTFAYFDLFKRPLTREEVTDFFLFEDPDDAKIDIYLNESPLICIEDGRYSLRSENFAIYNDRLKLASSYWSKIARWRFIFQICPFIKSVMVCNSLPIEDLDRDSDIDLFVITEKNRLFLARFWLTLLTHIFGVRRHGMKTKKRFCLSFYIEEGELSLKSVLQQPYDIYLAYWVKTLEPIAGDYSAYETFMSQNEDWLFPYFASFTRNRRYFRSRSKFHEMMKKLLTRICDRDNLERKAQNSQLRRIHEKLKWLHDKSGTVVSEKMLKFHDQDARAEVRKNWVKRVNELL